MTKIAARPMELAKAMMSQLTQRRWLPNRIEALTRNEFEKKNRNSAGTYVRPMRNQRFVSGRAATTNRR